MKRTTLLAVLAAALGIVASPAARAQDAMTIGRNLAATCANCHGTDGRAQDAMEKLAGVRADRIIQLFNDFKSGRKPATVMHQLAKGYSDEQIKLIAEFFAAQK